MRKKDEDTTAWNNGTSRIVSTFVVLRVLLQYVLISEQIVGNIFPSTDTGKNFPDTLQQFLAVYGLPLVAEIYKLSSSTMNDAKGDLDSIPIASRHG